MRKSCVRKNNAYRMIKGFWFSPLCSLFNMVAARAVFPGQAEADVIDGYRGGIVAELVGNGQKSAGEEVQVEVGHEEVRAADAAGDAVLVDRGRARRLE
jgi:hypothetical protein